MAENKQQKLQELQFLEHSIQNLILQKQAFDMELSETKSALEELNSSSEEVYKIIGQLMIKTDKKKILEELHNKEKLLSVRVSSLEKQEKSLSEKVESIREEILSENKKK
ncbi:Prefoldin subunit beta [uncultured archaeon]|nr:Prefoldin subunit beta [uncultured archaeon]